MSIRRSWLAALVLALIGPLVYPMAASAEGPSGSDSSRLGYVVVNEADASRVGDAVFYPTGRIADDTVVVIADAEGNLPGNITEAQLQQLVQTRNADARSTAAVTVGEPTRGGSQWSAPLGCKYGPIATSSTAVMGMNADYKETYAFWVNTGSPANGSAKGYYRGYNGSTFGTWASWYWIGSSSGATTKGTVPWGNTLAYPEFQGAATYCSAVSLGAYTS